MYVTSEHLRDQVIGPTLKYLGAWTPEVESFLLNTAVDAPELGLFSSRNDGLGMFHITSAQHRDIWDRYLAFNPDMASRVRGLASQRVFLTEPDKELQTNLGYSTAIALLLLQRSGMVLEEDASTPAQAQITG